MSFVGTRPEAVKYVEKYKPEYYATLLLPAGITSEASIRYKDEAKLVCVTGQHGSLFGMGRGAGNAKTELLADYINKYCGGQYDLQVLLETIDRYITPVLRNIHWGYDLPMYVCGTMHSHVDNVYHLSVMTKV